MKKLLSIILLIVICSSAFAQPFKAIREVNFKRAYIDSLIRVDYLAATSTGYSLVVYDSVSKTFRQIPASTYSTGCGDSTGGGGTGSVTSVGISSTDINVTGTNPIVSSGTFTLTLPTVNAHPGTFGNSHKIPIITANAKGLVTNLDSVDISVVDTTLFPAYVDSTTQAYQRILVAGRDGKISSDSMFLYNFAQNKVVINAKTSAKFGAAIKLYVNGGAVVNGVIARENGKANQFLKADGSLDTTHYVKSVKVNGTTFNVDTTTGNVDLGTIAGGGGSVTSFSKTDNWGITSSVTNPTTTPNYTAGVDSATLSGYYLRRKDSAVSYTTIKRLADTAATKNFKLGWYSVVDYGADTTGATDATSAIQAAINDAAAHGGGTVYFRKGTYKIAGAYKTTDGNGNGVNNAQIYIPLGGYSSNKPLYTIKLLGEVPPNSYMNFGDSIPNPVTGVVLKSTATTAGSIIGSAYTTVSWGDFNYTQLEMENICVRARSKRSNGVDTSNIQTGVDASAIAMFRANNIRIDIESIDTLSLAPASTAYGLKTPLRNNFADSYVLDAKITGYYTGLTINEHLSADNLFITTCVNGIEVLQMTHAAHISKALIVWCNNNIKISNKGYLTIDDLDVENYPGSGTGNFASRWYNNVRDIYEPSKTNSAMDIKYHRVLSGGAINETLTSNATSLGITTHTFDNSYTGFLTIRPPVVDTTNMLTLRSLSNFPMMILGTYPAVPSYGTIWTTGGVSPTATNYTLSGNGAETILNAPSATGISYRIANANGMKQTSTGLGIFNMSPSFPLDVTGNVHTTGKVLFDATNTATGTTGAQTINKASGSVNFAAGATSLVVTNSFVTTSSHIIPIVETNDASAFSIRVVPAAGSFTIFLVGTAPAAETKVGFIVFN